MPTPAVKYHNVQDICQGLWKILSALSRTRSDLATKASIKHMYYRGDIVPPGVSQHRDVSRRAHRPPLRALISRKDGPALRHANAGSSLVGRERGLLMCRYMHCTATTVLHHKAEWTRRFMRRAGFADVAAHSLLASMRRYRPSRRSVKCSNRGFRVIDGQPRVQDTSSFSQTTDPCSHRARLHSTRSITDPMKCLR